MNRKLNYRNLRKIGVEGTEIKWYQTLYKSICPFFILSLTGIILTVSYFGSGCLEYTAF